MVTSGKDGVGVAGKHVRGSNVADGRVEANGVEMVNEVSNEAACVVEAKRDAGTNAVGLERAMPAFDFAVALGIVRGSADVAETGDANELFEVAGDELRAVV